MNFEMAWIKSKAMEVSQVLGLARQCLKEECLLKPRVVSQATSIGNSCSYGPQNCLCKLVSHKVYDIYAM